MIGGAVLPTVIADTSKIYVDGFERGISWKPYIPLKRTTFVQFDEESYIDDYAFLAAVPTAVFYDKNKDQIFSNPLLFYQDEYFSEEEKERSLNAYQGVNYFMEDWMHYCNGQMDQMTLINVPKNKLDSSWRSREYILIEEDNPYDIASEIALKEWSYADNAVIAVIDKEFEKPNKITQGEISGSVPAYSVDYKHFDIEPPVIGTGGTYYSFKIEDERYKYIIARMSWDEIIDYDLQLYDDQLGMVDAAAGGYNQLGEEITGSYIHNYGTWEISVSAVPKKAPQQSIGKMENIFGSSTIKSTGLLSRLMGKNTVDVDLALYPGTMIQIMASPFGCRNVDFTLKWNNPGARLGFTVLDPVGTEIDSSISIKEFFAGEIEVNDNKAELHLDRLGECREGENYSVCIFSLDDISQPVDFTLDYSWCRNFSKFEGDCLTSASNGAALASILNSPLLYTSPSSLSDTTIDVLYKLGIENIYLVNIGGHLEKQVKEEINDGAMIKENYEEPREVYEAIRDMTQRNDIIFATIDPWSYWYINEREPAGEYPGALHIGPAAYIAAQHGSPVIIVDIHPRLSQATVYHTDFWVKHAVNRFIEVSSGSMVLSSKLAYDFLEEYGFGKIEDGKDQIRETIITVAGQFDIGTPWDRSFTGAAYPGRFWGSPVDSAYAICRNVFYPALIFVNPGMDDINLINGSKSRIQRIGGRLKEPKGVNLVITKPSMEEGFKYPILQTYNTYLYRFNEKASKHWDFLYTRADGIIPYVTDSLDSIDDGATTKAGAYYPDQSESEVIPFYANRAGYDSVFSTNFEKVVENLNRGVLIWVVNCHGYHMDGGMITMWDPDNPYNYEENPWRAYEPIMLNPGNLREYVRWLIYDLSGKSRSRLTDGFIKFHLLSEVGCTENPDVAHINTQLNSIHKLFKKLNIPGIIEFWGATGIMIYRDRLRHPLKSLAKGLPLINIYQGDGKVTISPLSGHQTMTHFTGLDFDDNLENLHSCGINAISCLPANTYLHLTWMRHGTTYQIIDPWTTTDWAAVWQQMIIKRLALGDTIGEAYERGMRATGPEYSVNQWWWDRWENVVLFGDPSLRVFVPGTQYNEANYWEREDIKSLRYDENISINGHMPFGAEKHPNVREPSSLLGQITWIVIIVAIFSVAIIGGIILIKKRRR